MIGLLRSIFTLFIGLQFDNNLWIIMIILLCYRPALIMMKEIIVTEGICGLYRGLPGMWIKEIPGSFIYFGSYHLARSFLQYLQEKEHLSK